jgi:hypothetical protein
MGADQPSRPQDTGPSPYAQPTPRRLYVHDDLSDLARTRGGPRAEASQLAQALLELLASDRDRVTVLTLDEQVDRVIAQGRHEPFARTLGIGRAGMRVAETLHARTGWFPSRRRLDLTREEDGRGGYRLVSTGPVALADQLAGLDDSPSLAVVDDTVFSGLTLRSVLDALPRPVLARTRAFCLRGVAESLAAVARLCPVTAGLSAPGRILEDVSFINASGLVLRIAIRRPGEPPLAFFDRPEWIRAWFPRDAEAVLDLCHRLNALLEPPARLM